jgi:regulator of replication initiation timing
LAAENEQLRLENEHLKRVIDSQRPTSFPSPANNVNLSMGTPPTHETVAAQQGDARNESDLEVVAQAVAGLRGEHLAANMASYQGMKSEIEEEGRGDEDVSMDMHGSEHADGLSR